MSHNVTNITDAVFEDEVLKSPTPVLVDFWAPWCNPCLLVAPILDEVANIYLGKLKVVKVNVDENRTTASKYNVRGIPNIIIFKNGEMQKQLVGAVDKREIIKNVDQVVG